MDPAFAVPLLRDLLHKGKTLRVIGAAAELGAIDDDGARAVLLDALDDPQDWIRLLAAEQLAAQGDPHARPVLLAAFATDDIDQFEHAISGICHYGDDDARRALEEAAEDSDAIPLLREVASSGLADVGTRASLPALESALTSGNSGVRRSARRAIETIDAPAGGSDARDRA